MTRKLCLLLAVSLAVIGAFFAPAASAQGEPTCAITFVEEAPTPTATPIAVEDDIFVGDEVATAGSADATAVHTCADAEAYPGPFTNMPVTPSSPYSAPLGLAASAPVAAPAPAESPTAGLAHSGSEVFVLAYLGTGLLAFGAVALGIRRSARIL